ncbi:toll/interleukin-1 receptor domain-containing protein [Pseudonocardia halophobica]|uniref:toll/interleukin-1 receptor domain-containing protein n=1 Tax=Pseudonocardia halophobica TaxID=29401 RepID=UPI003D8A0AA4
MELFISYSRLDEDMVKALSRGLEAGGADVWRDHELHGGDSWWSVILERIRACSVFVFALSDVSLHRSKPCRAELGYARALRRPVVPVQVGPVSSMRAMPLADLQVVQYRPDDATSGFAVLAAIHQARARVLPLPEPLPPPPPIPYAYLLALSQKIDVGELAPAEQMRIIDDLRRALADEHEDAVRNDILRMLREMRGKPWMVVRADQEIEGVLAAHDVPAATGRPTPEDGTPLAPAGVEKQTLPHRERATDHRRETPPPGWYPDPSRRHQWRWFDEDWTLWASDHGVTVDDPL